MADRTTEIQQLRDLIREAHGVLKDMRAERKVIEQLLDGIPAKVDARIEEAMKVGLTEMGDQIKTEMGRSVAKVGREFDRLEAIFTGTDPESRRAGEPPLEDVLRRARAAKEAADRG